jgi:hypothetical protein
MGEWYTSTFVDTGRSAALWALIGFLVTFTLTRAITLRIRRRSAEAEASGVQPAEGGAIKDVYIGGVHIHHQVWGILLVLVTGLLAFRYQPGSPWNEVLATLFGVGAALALDEFALWLHVDDVYWSEEGRKSIDAVIVAVVVGFALLIGGSPIAGVEASVQEGQSFLLVALVIVVHVGYTIVCMLKGKLITGLIGLPVPVVSLVGAIRLAKPESFWAKRHYAEVKMARSHSRFDEEQAARRERVRELFGAGRSGP